MDVRFCFRAVLLDGRNHQPRDANVRNNRSGLSARKRKLPPSRLTMTYMEGGDSLETIA